MDVQFRNWAFSMSNGLSDIVSSGYGVFHVCVKSQDYRRFTWLLWNILKLHEWCCFKCVVLLRIKLLIIVWRPRRGCDAMEEFSISRFQLMLLNTGRFMQSRKCFRRLPFDCGDWLTGKNCVKDVLQLTSSSSFLNSLELSFWLGFYDHMVKQATLSCHVDSASLQLCWCCLLCFILGYTWTIVGSLLRLPLVLPFIKLIRFPAKLFVVVLIWSVESIKNFTLY